jgi:hypothetical protein
VAQKIWVILFGILFVVASRIIFRFRDLGLTSTDPRYFSLIRLHTYNFKDYGCLNCGSCKAMYASNGSCQDSGVLRIFTSVFDLRSGLSGHVSTRMAITSVTSTNGRNPQPVGRGIHMRLPLMPAQPWNLV